MAYGRTLRIVAGGKTLISMQGVENDVQNVRFEIHQQTLQSPNTAIVRVFNPAVSTAHGVPDGLKTHGMLEIYGGYTDESTGLLFKGDIVQRRIGKENPVTTFVEIRAKDGDSAYNNAKVSATVPKGKPPQAQVDVASKAMQALGVKQGYVTPGLLSAPTYSRGVVLFSLARDVLRNIAASKGANWSIQNGELQMVRRDDAVPGTITINANTGMIGMPIETPNGIIVRSLLDARVKVNSKIKINENDIQRGGVELSNNTEISRDALTRLSTSDGTYKVLCVNREGGSREQEWYNEIICIGTTGTSNAQKDYPDFNGGNAPAPPPETQPAPTPSATAQPDFNSGTSAPGAKNPYGDLSGVHFP